MPTFSLKGRQPEPKQVKKLTTEDICAIVALHYTQYTFEYLVNEMPLRNVMFLYDTIQRQRAENFLLLNAIINGPNSKDESHQTYKKTIESLTKLVE